LESARGGPDARPPQTFGRLIEELGAAENGHKANTKTVERLAAGRGEHLALTLHARMGIEFRGYLDRLRLVPGVRDLEMLCDLRSVKFSAESLKTLKAELCMAEGLAPANAEALAVPDAAARLRALLSPPVSPAGRQPERSASIDRAALRSAFEAVIRTETTPPAEAILHLGLELHRARLVSFAYDAIPNSGMGAGFLRGVLRAAMVRHHQTEALLPEAEESVRQLIAQIERNGLWLHVRDELAKLSKRADAELEARTPPPTAPAEEDTPADTPRKKRTPRPKNAAELLRVHKRVKRGEKGGLTREEAVREFVEENYPDLKTDKVIRSKVATLIRYLNRYKELLEPPTDHEKP
jgi:hypothetical protein